MSAQVPFAFGVQTVRRIETPAARATDPATSHEAADIITTSGRRQAHIERVVAAVRAHPGLTSAELAPHAGLERHEAARRLPEAETAGQVRKGPPRICSTSGRRAVTWEVSGG